MYVSEQSNGERRVQSNTVSLYIPIHTVRLYQHNMLTLLGFSFNDADSAGLRGEGDMGGAGPSGG